MKRIHLLSIPQPGAGLPPECEFGDGLGWGVDELTRSIILIDALELQDFNLVCSFGELAVSGMVQYQHEPSGYSVFVTKMQYNVIHGGRKFVNNGRREPGAGQASIQMPDVANLPIPAKVNTMVKERFKVLLVCLFAFAVADLSAQSEQFKFKRLDLKDGLCNPDIWSIFKDSRGFVWFGTASGLNRFDGYTMKAFLYDPHDTTSILPDGIRRIFETPEGLLAVQTFSGLTLYDHRTERFERHVQHFLKRYGISKDVYNIVPDAAGVFWFVEPGKLVRYDSKGSTRIVIGNDGADSLSITGSAITDFCIDRNGNHWVVHSDGIAEKIVISNQQGKVAQRISVSVVRDKAGNTDYRILADRDGDLWFCAPRANQGVVFYNIKQNKLLRISTKSARLPLNTNAVSGMLEDENGLIWLATDHGGINILDKGKGKVQYILHRDGDETSLVANSIVCLYKDDQGIIWAGAYKRGVSYYHPHIYKFEVYKHHSLDPGSLPFEDINGFEEDEKGNLWIGTNGGGLLYFDRETGKFKQYLNEPGNANTLSGNVVVSLCRDTKNNLWIGTYKAGLNKFDGKKFTRFSQTPGQASSLPSQNVWEIFEDSRKRLWVGTVDAGVGQLDVKTGKFNPLTARGANGLRSGSIEEISEDRHGNIWFGTPEGIDVMLEDSKTFLHYGSSSQPHSLSSNFVFDIMKDSQGRMWIATANGLNLFDESINGFRTFKDNRTSTAVLTVEEDAFGNIWISTFDGLSKMTFVHDALDSVTFKHYTESDGLQGRQFNINASWKTRKGELIFGGPTGFNISNGSESTQDFAIRKIVFSELELYEKPVGIGEKIDGRVVLDRSISETDEIVLPPNKNFFSLKFSDLNYFNPERDHFAYMLDGLRTGWLPADTKSHEIVLNGLNPGRYLLRLRAANGDGVWGEKEAVLSIVIMPPFWKTRTAFVLYAILVLTVLVLTRRMIQQREKLKYTLEHERQEMQRIHELDMMKVKFFTNVSHEFRTPLTLILTPIERLLSKSTDPEQLALFQLVHRNGRRLMNLVNQLLDFKKLEAQQTKFSPAQGDIIAFLRDTVASFSDLSERKNIALTFHSAKARLETLFDHDKLEKIMFNLLGNAFKFTLENGFVSVNVAQVTEDGEAFLQIEVRDSGIGIPQNKLDNIFEPFFQTDVPKSIVNQGSGIGLAITKEFLKIHGGRIAVDSEVGRGSSFKVMLPLREMPVEEVIEPAAEMSMSQSETPPLPAATADAGEEEGIETAKKKSLLLIEDNDDFRFYLRDNLKFLYTIHEASNGADGWRLVLSEQPDLVVSDIMMPEMSGIELCAKIKADTRVSHIPIILLTARSSEEQRVEGFKTGADDYITKPFNFEILEARIDNLLRQREKFQKTFRKTLDVKSSELQITPLDVKFIDKAVKVVEANISSPNFSIEDLGMELGISRAYVFKKILALTGKTPLEFIRTLRLQHAAQLLGKSQLSVREVAYKVGFNNPKYFAKYFKEQYQILPSEYAASREKEQ